MANGILLLGYSGTGKSASLRNYKRGEASVINVASKPLPFRSELATLNTSNYSEVVNAIKGAKAPVIVIDDATYLMQFENFDRAMEHGYDKFTEMAQHFYSILQAIKDAPANKIVVVIGHLAKKDDGSNGIKTIGRMLDEKLTVEGLFSIVLQSIKDETGYWFLTNSQDPACPVKTPIGMFDEAKIPNDMQFVTDVVTEFFGLDAREAQEAKEA